MQREVFVVEKERFDLSDEKIYHLQGTWPKEHTAAAELDGKSLEVNLKRQERISALERFQDLDLVDAIRVQMEIVLPDKLEQYKKLVVYAKENGKKEVWFSIPVKQLIRRQGMPQYFIESSEVAGNSASAGCVAGQGLYETAKSLSGEFPRKQNSM